MPETGPKQQRGEEIFKSPDGVEYAVVSSNSAEPSKVKNEEGPVLNTFAHRSLDEYSTAVHRFLELNNLQILEREMQQTGEMNAVGWESMVLLNLEGEDLHDTKLIKDIRKTIVEDFNYGVPNYAADWRSVKKITDELDNETSQTVIVVPFQGQDYAVTAEELSKGLKTILAGSLKRQGPSDVFLSPHKVQEKTNILQIDSDGKYAVSILMLPTSSYVNSGAGEIGIMSLEGIRKNAALLRNSYLDF